MRELVLKNYFEGNISPNQLAEDLKDSRKKDSYDVTHYFIEDIDDHGEYNLTTKHLIKLCDDMLSGSLTLDDINTIAFALNSSEYFTWDELESDGKRLSETIFAWDNPEIDYPLTVANIQLWKHYLITGESKFNQEELKNRS